MMLHGRNNDLAFTLVEVLVAIAFMAVAMLGLLRLQVVSIRSTDHARRLSQATLLADAKMAETLAAGCTDVGAASGTTDAPAAMDWQVRVEDAPVAELPDLAGVRSVTVRVNWKDGRDVRQVQLVTYALAGGRQ